MCVSVCVCACADKASRARLGGDLGFKSKIKSEAHVSASPKHACRKWHSATYTHCVPAHPAQIECRACRAPSGLIHGRHAEICVFPALGSGMAVSPKGNQGTAGALGIQAEEHVQESRQ